MRVTRIIKKSPRFGILFVSIIIAIIFTCLDIAASIHPFIGDTDGINPFWKLSLVFKCLTDAILLDDFKTELKRLGLKRLKRDEKRRESVALTLEDDYLHDSDEEAAMHFSNGNIGTHLQNGDTPFVNGFAQRSSINPHRKSTGAEGSEQVEFMSALQAHPSQLSSDRESRRESMQRPQVGQGGKPATKLPKLFASIKPGKKAKKATEEPATRSDSIWTLSNEYNEDELEPEAPVSPPPAQKKGRKWLSRSRDDTNDTKAANDIQFEDDALERARMEQQRTIAELKRRKNSAVSAAGNSLSPNAAERVGQQRKSGGGANFWDGIDGLEHKRNDDVSPSASQPRLS